MTLRKPCPKGQCRQCWTHAYDPDIHRSQDQRTDCAACVDHMKNGCPSDQIQK
ncbi:pRL2-8 [Streptomyces canus]|uniref:pRL2-8 n=1 Tax=Streptomyces canus TaxID=58343 RepID=UPI00324DDF68